MNTITFLDKESLSYLRSFSQIQTIEGTRKIAVSETNLLVLENFSLPWISNQEEFSQIKKIFLNTF